MAWFDNYLYRKQITISHSAGTGAGENYQVKLLIGKTSDATGEYFDLGGHVLDSFFDIRFTDDDEISQLAHWIESVVDSGTSKLATIWVKVADSLESANADIYIYYGKAGDSDGSDGGNTFVFFDDFDDFGGVPTYKIFGTDGALQYGDVPASLYGSINPAAIYNPSQNKTYIIYQFENGGYCDRKILYYDHTSNTFSSAIAIGGTTKVDAHGAPSITIDADGYIHVFYYGGGADVIYFKKSTNAYDITSWGAEQEVPGGSHTYPQPYLHGTNIYLIYVDYNGGTGRYGSFNRYDGTSWLGETRIVEPSTNYPYPRSYRDSSGTFHVGWSWYNGSIRKDIYYMKSTDGGLTWTEADGTSLTIPVSETTAEKVYDSGSDFCQISTGDIQADSTGKPLILFVSNRVYMLARWDGTLWVINNVVSVDNDFDCGTLVLDSDTQFRAYINIGAGRGGELEEYLSIDSGLTWEYQKTISGGTALTVLNVFNMSSDRNLEIIFCGGDGGNQAVCAWGKNCTYGPGYALDTNKWDSSGTIEVANSEVTLNQDDIIRGKTIFGYGYAVHAKVKADEQDTVFIGWRDRTEFNTGNPFIEILNSDSIYPDDFDIFNCRSCISSGDNHYVDNQLDFRNVYRTYEITRISGHAEYYQDGNLVSDRTTDLPTVDLYPVLNVWDSSQASTLIADWVLVRKYTATEPTWSSTGGEEDVPVVIIQLLNHLYNQMRA